MVQLTAIQRLAVSGGQSPLSRLRPALSDVRAGLSSARPVTSEFGYEDDHENEPCSEQAVGW